MFSGKDFKREFNPWVPFFPTACPKYKKVVTENSPQETLMPEQIAKGRILRHCKNVTATWLPRFGRSINPFVEMPSLSRAFFFLMAEMWQSICRVFGIGELVLD